MTMLSRRKFLYLAVVTGGAAVAGWKCIVSRASDPLEEILGLLDAQSAGPLGKALVAAKADYNDRSGLVAALSPLCGRGRDEARKNIAQAVQDDFRANKTINVSGWILSETEARLYALKFLTPSR